MSENLFVDIVLNKEQVQSDVNNINNIFNTLNQTFNTLNINVVNLFGNIQKEAEKTKKIVSDAFRVFMETGTLKPEIETQAINKGNKNVFKMAQKNVTKETELGNEFYIKERTQAIKLAEQQKQIDRQIKQELGLIKDKTKQVNQETKKVNDNTNKVAKSTNSWVKGLAKIGLSLAGVRRLGQLIGELVSESGSWIENLNLFEVTFGKASKETIDWAIDLSKQLGFSTNELVKFTGLFKQLSTSIGIAEDIGNSLSKTLTQIGIDITSFYNLTDITQAMEKLQAGIFSGRVLPHSKVIYYANSSNSRKLFINKNYKDNLEQRLDKVA